MATLQRIALPGTPKATKQAARYTPAGGAERCGMCRHYVPSSSCARIEGPVSAAGWCQLYSQQVTWRPRAGQAAGLNTGGVPAAGLDLSFMTPGSLDSRITFTRASTATYFDVNGTLQTATANAPRWDYDPVTHALRGLLMEEARTNILLNSATLGTQSVTVTAQAYTLSFYGTGTVTLSGASTAGPLAGTGAFPQRVSLLFTPSAGTLTLTVTGTVQNAQLEHGVTGNFVTSYIPTTAAAVTRQFDAAAITGASFTSWFTNAAGSFALEYLYATAATGTTNRLIELLDGTATNFLAAVPDFLAARHQLASTIASVAGTNVLVPGGIVAGTVVKASLAYGVNRSMCTNVGAGVGAVASTPGGIATVSQVNFGNRPAGDRPICGYVRRVRFWPQELTAAQLQAVAT